MGILRGSMAWSRGTIIALGGALGVAVAAPSCLIAYDFDEYGAGGASSSSSISASASGAGGAGPGDGLSTCRDGEVTYTVLPVGWTEVRVVQLGRGFVAAPRDILEYLIVPEPTDSGSEPIVTSRSGGTEGLLGLFRLEIEGSDRVVGVRTDGAVLKLKGFDLGEGSDPVSATFRSARQFAGEPANMLVSFEREAGTVVQAQVFSPTWSLEGDRPTVVRPLDGLIDEDDEPACLVDACEFRSAIVAAEDGQFFAAYLGQGLTDDAVVGETLVGKGPFIAVAGEDAEGPSGGVFELDDYLDEAFEVGAAGQFYSGVLGDRNATIRFENEEIVPATKFGEGEARAGYPSRFAKKHWMITEFVGDVPDVAVFELGAGNEPVFGLPGATGFDVATVGRTNASRVGVLISAMVPVDRDVAVGGCTLPAGRAVLAERDVAAP